MDRHRVGNSFTCGVCSHTIGAGAPHMMIDGTVVCLSCTGTREAHDLTACPVDWHDGWDHTTAVTDQAAARVLLSRPLESTDQLVNPCE